MKKKTYIPLRVSSVAMEAKEGLLSLSTVHNQYSDQPQLSRERSGYSFVDDEAE